MIHFNLTSRGKHELLLKTQNQSHIFRVIILGETCWISKKEEIECTAKYFNQTFVQKQIAVNNFQVVAPRCVTNGIMHIMHDQNTPKFGVEIYLIYG